jgi:hypothetical protein
LIVINGPEERANSFLNSVRVVVKGRPELQAKTREGYWVLE